MPTLSADNAQSAAGKRNRQPSPVPMGYTMKADAFFNAAPAAVIHSPPSTATLPPQQAASIPATYSPQPPTKSPAAIVPSVVENFDETSRSNTPGQAIAAEEAPFNPFAETSQSDMQENISFAGELSTQDFSVTASSAFVENISTPSQAFLSTPPVPASFDLTEQYAHETEQSAHKTIDASLQEFEEIDPNPRKYGLFQLSSEAPATENASADPHVVADEVIADVDDLVFGAPPTTDMLPAQESPEVTQTSAPPPFQKSDTVDHIPFSSAGQGEEPSLFGAPSAYDGK
jgi:hypothetical protein